MTDLPDNGPIGPLLERLQKLEERTKWIEDYLQRTGPNEPAERTCEVCDEDRLAIVEWLCEKAGIYMITGHETLGAELFTLAGRLRKEVTDAAK